MSPSEDQPSVSVRHYLGRMGSVFRAARRLVELAPDHIELFESFDVKPVPCGGPLPGPSVDAQLTLAGIARRMTNDDDLFQTLKEALDRLDNAVGIMKLIEDRYNDKTFRPRVHAEVALLDALHTAKIEFYNDDRYIACSKAACFCCYQYICAHPGNFVKPAGHNNLWLNWRFSDLVEAAPTDTCSANGRAKRTDDATTKQKRIMNDTIAKIRTVAIEKVLRSSGIGNRWRPDSSTGITATASVAANPLEDDHRLASIEEYLEQLHIEQASEDEIDDVDGGVLLGRTALMA